MSQKYIIAAKICFAFEQIWLNGHGSYGCKIANVTHLYLRVSKAYSPLWFRARKSNQHENYVEFPCTYFSNIK